MWGLPVFVSLSPWMLPMRSDGLRDEHPLHGTIAYTKPPGNRPHPKPLGRSQVDDLRFNSGRNAGST